MSGSLNIRPSAALFVLLLLAPIAGFSQTDAIQSYKKGKIIFQSQCSSCHGIRLEKTGPMLASITKKKEREWLVQFIRNSQSVIVSGDPYANFIYASYHQQVMPSFTHLSNNEIQQVLTYIEQESYVGENESETKIDLDILQQDDNSLLPGRTVFQNQCATCHFIHHEGSYGPALGSVTKRRPLSWLIPFIHNSQKVIDEQDPYAMHIFNAFEKRPMVAMEFLSTEEILQVLNYIEYSSSSPHAQAGVNGRKLSKGVVAIEYNFEETTNAEKFFFKALLIILSILVALLIAYLVLRLFTYLNINSKPDWY